MGGIYRVKLSDLLPMVPPALVALMSLVEVSPIKINPWSGLAKWLGRAINEEVLSTVKTIQTTATTGLCSPSGTSATCTRSSCAGGTSSGKHLWRCIHEGYH